MKYEIKKTLQDIEEDIFQAAQEPCYCEEEPGFCPRHDFHAGE